MKPDYERGGVRLWNCDCLELLPTLEAGSVDAVVTDPPYGMSNNTNSRRFTGGNRALRPVEGRDDWPEVRNDDKPFDPSPWLGFPRVVLWGSHHYAARLPVGSCLIWLKKADHLFGTFLSDAEIAWMKGGCGVYCFRKQFPPPVRIAEGGGKCLHPNQKPIELLRWCLDMTNTPTEATVADPYMGSGTTGVACIQTGRCFLGCEIDPRYFDIACKRIDAAIDAGALFDPQPPAIRQGGLFEDQASTEAAQ